VVFRQTGKGGENEKKEKENGQHKKSGLERTVRRIKYGMQENLLRQKDR